MKTISGEMRAGFIAAALALSFVAPVQAQNLLADPGFESGTPVAGGVGGWGPFDAGSTFSQDYAHSGSWSLESAYNGDLVIGSQQIVPAIAGYTYTLTGYMFTPNTLSVGESQGTVVTAFLNSSMNYYIGNGGFIPMGVINSSSPAGTWIPFSQSVVAPAGAFYIQVVPELFGGSTGDKVYFDDFVLTPEPSTLALAGAGAAAMLGWARRRR